MATLCFKRNVFLNAYREENPMGGRAWWTAVHGVAKSRTRLHFHFPLLCIGEGNGNPLQYSCLENPRDGILAGCHLWDRTESDMTEATSSGSSREGEKNVTLVCFFLPLTGEIKNVWHLQPICTVWRPLAFPPTTLSVPQSFMSQHREVFSERKVVDKNYLLE